MVFHLYLQFLPKFSGISLEMPVPSQGHFGFHSFRLLTDFVCLYTYEVWLSLCKIVRSSVILLLPLYNDKRLSSTCICCRTICYKGTLLTSCFLLEKTPGYFLECGILQKEVLIKSHSISNTSHTLHDRQILW
jgi:hypothetical protein